LAVPNLYEKKPVRFLLLFCLLAVTLRFFSFFPSVIDHDESTYLEIARMLLSGKILYVDMVDIKPPGIFLILAGLQAVFVCYAASRCRLDRGDRFPGLSYRQAASQ
jgi:hypothetical protein